MYNCTNVNQPTAKLPSQCALEGVDPLQWVVDGHWVGHELSGEPLHVQVRLPESGIQRLNLRLQLQYGSVEELSLPFRVTGRQGQIVGQQVDFGEHVGRVAADFLCQVPVFRVHQIADFEFVRGDVEPEVGPEVGEVSAEFVYLLWRVHGGILWLELCLHVLS